MANHEGGDKVVFRSKAEAVFAGALSFAGWTVDYEPADAHYQWGFKIRGSDGPLVRQVLIEYKPTKPTIAYYRDLVEAVRGGVEEDTRRRVARLHAVLDSGDIGKMKAIHFGGYCSYLVFGNPLGGAGRMCSEMYTCWPVFADIPTHDGWGDFNPEIHFPPPASYVLRVGGSEVREAMAYRYDVAE